MWADPSPGGEVDDGARYPTRMAPEQEQQLGPFDLTDEIGTSIGAKGNAVDRTLPRDPAAAELLAREEYALLLDAEKQQQRRLHKGHPLHNLGVILVYIGRADEARTYFHAAHAEDTRSVDPDDEGWGWLARQVLLDLYGERPSLIEKLGEMAEASPEDPLTLARRFEGSYGPFKSYRGIRAGRRDESRIDSIPADQLVFCAGSHSLPHHLTAMADGVRASGLEPVVVMEFKNPSGYDAAASSERARMDYEKSERLLSRCGLVVMDLSDPMGQTIELEKAKQANVPMFIGFVSNDPLGTMHGSSMYQGAAAVSGVKPRGFRNTDELRDEVRDWCLANASPAGSPSIVLIRPSAIPPIGLQGSNIVVGSGSAVPSTMARPIDFEPFEAVPSGEYAASDPEPMILIDDADDGADEDRDP